MKQWSWSSRRVQVSGAARRTEKADGLFHFAPGKKVRRDLLVLATTGLMMSSASVWGAAAQATQSASENHTETSRIGDEEVVLDPFAVTTESDRGYKATNATSGTRLDTAIKEIPLAVEVITSQFIADTGATTLRESLRYSAGVQLQSQNDYSGNGFAQYRNVGGVNNPEMQTANRSDSVFIIRGFTTENALRDGFRRKVTTDAGNIERIEIVRGPSSLLYGIGNFGGIVNYILKTPGKTEQGAATFVVGDDDLLRGTIDATGRFANGRGGYRITAAAQRNGDDTDYFSVRKFAVAPFFTFRPWANTELTIDTELGRTDSSGVGFQSIRARADALGNDGRQEHAGWIAFPGQDLRTMRWSGPDTHLNSRQGNLELKVVQHLADGLTLLGAYNHSSVTFDTRDVNAAVGNNIGPIELWSTLTPVPLDASRGDTDANWAASPIPHSIIAYSWADSRSGTRTDQSRVELNYQFDFFPRRGWLTVKNNVLVGATTDVEFSTNELHTLDSTNSVYDWKSATDPTPFRYATQGDGSASLPLRLRHWNSSKAEETGAYAIYHGKFFDGKLVLLGGVRGDRNGVSTRDIGYVYSDGSVDSGATSAYSPEKKSYVNTQIGVSVSPVPELSFYALRSEGLTANFSGARDLTGKPMDAVTAVNIEFGTKFDFFGGRLSGTISHYRITRTGQPNGSFWWGPQTGTHRFDSSKPVVYNVTDLNPDAAQVYTYHDNTGATVPLIQWNNNYAYWGDLSPLSAVPAGAAGSTATLDGLHLYQTDGLNDKRVAIESAWSQAKSAGAVQYWDKNGNTLSEPMFASLIAASGPGSAYITLIASKPEGAAYLDAVYGYVRAAGTAHPGSDNWPGWYFNSAPAATGYNSAAQDTNGFANTTPFSAPETDRNTGWDGQIVFTPNDRWQLLLSFEKNNHTILSLGQFPDYPWQQLDRWAPWMFPNGQWGLSGYYGTNEQYSDETKTSTFSFKGLIYPGAQGMDYPKWSWSAFTNVRVTAHGPNGLRVGGGVIETGPQEYESGFTHAGDALKDSAGTPIILTTSVRWTANVFARYDFSIGRRLLFVQVNVDNVFDDQKRYGLLWAPGRSVRLTASTSF